MNILCFDKYVKMSTGLFQYLLCVIGPKIAKKDTRLRKAFKPDESFYFCKLYTYAIRTKNIKKKIKTAMDSTFI